MNSPPLPANFCPSCARQLDMATDPTEKAVPKPGDFSVCLYCCQVLQFGPQLQLAARDLDTLPIETRIRLRDYIHAIKTMGPSP